MEELIMENSIIKTIKLDLSEKVNNLDLLLEKEIKEVPAGYEVSQISKLGSSDNTGVFAITFNRVHYESINGMPNTVVPTPKKLQDTPSPKQLKYLAYLVDSLQPEDFPGIDEINSSRIAGKWIKKLKDMQAGK